MSAANWLNSGIMANQRFNPYSIAGIPVQAIGNPRPPNIGGPAGINSNMLQVASPKSYDLTQATYVNTTASDQAALNCRTTYTGRSGLAQLMTDTADNTFYDAGCGFYYNSATGVARGALGFNTETGPETVYNLPGEPDDTRNATFYMVGAANGNDLNRAILDMKDAVLASATAGGAHGCGDMQAISAENKPYYGFCKTTNTIIPTNNGNAVAINGPNTCLSENIIAATDYASCPAGFRNYEAFQGRGSQAGSSSRIGSGRHTYLETFQNPVLNCTTPLSSDCLVQAALSAGCSDNGSLAQALKGSTSPPYSQNLSHNAAYKAYQANSGAITSATMRDGTVSVNTALSDFHDLYANMNSSNPQISAAARDLCLSNGHFDSYDFCGELTDLTVIGETYLPCIQSEFIKAGGSTKGSAYPNANQYSQTTYQGFRTVLKGLISKMNSGDPANQASAKAQFTG